MRYFSLFVAVLASSHISVLSHYMKKRTHSEIGPDSGECDDPYHVIKDDERFLNAMTSEEYIAHHARAAAKAARMRRLRKLKRPSDSYYQDDRDERNDLRSVSGNVDKNVDKNVDRNVNRNVNANVSHQKNRAKVIKKSPTISRNRLEVIEVSGSDELIDNRDVEFGFDHPQLVEARKLVDPEVNHAGNASSASRKKNLSSEAEDPEGVTTSTPKSTFGVGPAASDPENASGDLEPSNPMESEDALEDISKKPKEDHLHSKQRDPKRKHHSKSKKRDKTLKNKVNPKISQADKWKPGEKGERVKADVPKDFESRSTSEDAEEHEMNNGTATRPSEKDEGHEPRENLDDRNQTIPNLRRLFPKFKGLGRIRGPQWSGSDLLMYAIDTARKSNSDTGAENRILQDTIDPQYLPDDFKPVKRNKNVKRYKRIDKNKRAKKSKHVKVTDDDFLPIVPLTQRPPINKHRFRSATQKSDKHDDDVDDEDKRPTETTTRRNVNKNINRNVNVNFNANNLRDSSEEPVEQINVMKYASNRKALDVNTNPEDTELVKRSKFLKNINKRRNKNDDIIRNPNHGRWRPHELTQKELEDLFKKYQDKENQSIYHPSAEYY